jgi:hypothetical protein
MDDGTKSQRSQGSNRAPSNDYDSSGNFDASAQHL